MYYDIENNCIVTIKQLEEEYSEKIKSHEIEKSEQSFLKYIENCLTIHNGTLDEL